MAVKAKTGQLPLDLPLRQASGAADFVVSDSNRAAIAFLDRWPDWPGFCLAIYGPEGCGKSHLGHVFQARSKALFLESTADPGALPENACLVLDEPRMAETTLFHLINRIRQEGGSLLLLSRLAPARWPVRLPDLASRLKAMNAIGVEPPDDELLAAVLRKHFADRQVSVGADVIQLLVRRIERSFAEAERVAHLLDRAALAQGRAITAKLVGEILAGEN
jgi:chromosomal replication initiation ATPase DnaA